MDTSANTTPGGSLDTCMEEEIASLTSNLSKKVVVSLDHVDWEDSKASLKYAVLLKLASGRVIQKDAFEETFGRVWQLSEPASFQKVERDTLLVSFRSQEDQIKVMEGGPWTFEGSVVLMQKWRSGMNGEDFRCTKFNIWVHIYNLPYELRNQSFAMVNAKLAGDVKELSSRSRNIDLGFAAEYMKVRIEIDATKPILQGFFLKRAEGAPVWVHLKYVKLPNLCFNCGCFIHDIRWCRKQGTIKNKLFGKWLKADERSVFRPEWSDGKQVGPEQFLVISLEVVDGRRVMVIEGQNSQTEADPLGTIIKVNPLVSCNNVVHPKHGGRIDTGGRELQK